MGGNSRLFTQCCARFLCFVVAISSCASVWAQDSAPDPSQITTQGSSDTSQAQPTETPAPQTQPPITAAGAAGRQGREGTRGDPFNPLEPLSTGQTSAQQDVDQGLAPTLDRGVSTSAFANGIVSTFPGATSFGANAAGAAAGARNFLTAFANQSAAYSDNPGNLGTGQTIASPSQISNLNRPDLYEVTSGGVLISKTISLQNFFASANFGFTNYAHDTNFNSTRYNFSVGDNYMYTDECAGTIVANQSQTAVPLEFTTGSLTAQNTINTSGEMTSRCKVTGHIYTTTDLRASRDSFTGSAVGANSANQLLGSVGLEYFRGGFITTGVLASIQQSDFTQRSTLIPGLSNRTFQTNIDVFVNKPISPKLNISLSGGISSLSLSSPGFSGVIQPLFTATITYAYSPKTSFFANYAHLTGSPISFVSNFQQLETIGLGASYRYSPKTNFTAFINRSTTSGGGTTAGISQLLAESATTSEQISANYLFYKDAFASLSYQHTTRESAFLFGQATANLISLSLSYRR